MSQHIFSCTDKKTHRPLRVMAGWDPPLQRYFLDIELEDASDEEDEYLFSSMREVKYITQKMTFRDLQIELNLHGIEVPDEFFTEIEAEFGSPRDGGNGSKVKFWVL